MRVIVAGGGIGGLTTAIALEREGHEVVVLEKRERLEDAGAGIVLAPNARRILEGLGVRLAGAELGEVKIALRDGRVLSRMRPQEYCGLAAIAVRRAALHDALRASWRGVIRQGVRVEGVRQSEDGVVVGTSEGEMTGELLVGADGLHSRVREWGGGMAEPLRYSGMVCWRDVVPNPGFCEAMEVWGGAARIGVVPLGKDELYVYWVLTAEQGGGEVDWEGSNVFREFGGLMKKLSGRVPALRHEIWEMEGTHWGEGRVLLVGDAAHAMTPNQGQGAAMAIEDAIVLARVARGEARNWAKAYRALREKRVRKVQLDSRRLGEVAHWENRWACVARDWMLRLTPGWAMERQYRGLVEPGLALA